MGKYYLVTAILDMEYIVIQKLISKIMYYRHHKKYMLPPTNIVAHKQKWSAHANPKEDLQPAPKWCVFEGKDSPDSPP